MGPRALKLHTVAERRLAAEYGADWRGEGWARFSGQPMRLQEVTMWSGCLVVLIGLVLGLVCLLRSAAAWSTAELAGRDTRLAQG